MLDTLFGVAQTVTAPQEIARAILVFLYGFVAARLIGRRVFARWSALDIVVSIVMGSNLSRTLTGNAPLWGTLGATTALLAAHWVLAQAASRSVLLSRILEGRGVELVTGGRPNPRRLRRWSVSDADLNEALHQRGLTSTGEAELMILEPSGTITVVERAKGG